MLCVYCDKEGKGKFCQCCGRKMATDRKEFDFWKKQFEEHSREKLKDLLEHREQYQDDAIIAAEFLLENGCEDEEDDAGKASEEEKIWFYVINGEQRGPISEAMLLELLRSEKINEETLVWKAGYENWVSLKQAGIHIPNRTQTPPPLACNQINNIPIIILLFVPLISTLVQYLVAGIFQIEVNKIWWIAYGMNVLLCTIDFCILKKAGYKTGKLKAAFCILVPLYIYKRMSLVKGKKWLFTLIWTMFFVADMCMPPVLWVKVIGMSNPSMIEMVKQGEFYDYDDKKVGKIFEDALEDCEWDTYMGTNRRVLVQVKGEYGGSHVDIVFELDTDSSFEVSYMSVGGNKCSKKEQGVVLKHFCEK